ATARRSANARRRATAAVRSGGAVPARRARTEGGRVEIVTKKHLMLFAGTSHPELASEIADGLGIPISPCEIRRFASSEIYVRPVDRVRGADVFVIQTHCAPVSETIMELLILLDALN